MAIYAIGDIHGCYDELRSLIQKIKFDISKDKLIFTGDLVNRGRDTLKVLRYIKSLGNSALITLGNHDIVFIANYYDKDIVCSNKKQFCKQSDSEEIIDWLCAQKIMISYKNYTISHAGICPSWSQEKASTLAKELEDIIANKKTRSLFFENIIGDSPDIWHHNLKGYERLRCISNYFTRMRLCDKNGRMIFKESQEPNKKEDIYLPWFEVRKNFFDEKNRFIFGHWSALNGITNNNNYIAIDTGCVWGKTLTAYSIDEDIRYEIAYGTVFSA